MAYARTWRHLAMALLAVLVVVATLHPMAVGAADDFEDPDLTNEGETSVSTPEETTTTEAPEATTTTEAPADDEPIVEDGPDADTSEGTSDDTAPDDDDAVHEGDTDNEVGNEDDPKQTQPEKDQQEIVAQPKQQEKVVAAAPNVCPQPHVQVSGDRTSIQVSAPTGFLIAGYCVKAGPEAHSRTVEPPVASMTIESLTPHPVHADKRLGISHYSLVLVPDVPVVAAEITVAKAVTSGPVLNAAANHLLTYEIVVSNAGDGPGVYDLADRIMFGNGVTVVTASVTNTTPGTIATNAAWNGTTQHQVVTGVSLAAGDSHTYRVTVEASVAADITDAARDCNLDHGEDGTGFFNKAIIRVDGEDSFSFDCVEVPEPDIAMAKKLTSGPTRNPDGTYDLVYEIKVTNTGDGPGRYHLDDELKFGDGVSVVGAAVANTVPGVVTTNASWDGISEISVAAGVGIAALDSHTYEVTVEASVATSITHSARDCTLDQGEEGTGFLNEATVTVGNDVLTDDDCAGIPDADISVLKTVTSGPTLNDAGNYLLSYEIVVSNASDGPGVYDLADRIMFGDGVTVMTAAVTNTDPGTIVTKADWNGLNKHQVVTGVSLAAGDSHTYRVTMEASVAADITDAARDCDLDHGEDGTGFFNKAIIRVGGEDNFSFDCVEVPEPAIGLSKDLVSGPVLNAAGNYEVAYQIMVSNTGQGPGTYDLDDKLLFGDGITVVAATVAAIDPASIVADPAWDGITEISVAAGVGIVALGSHTYRVEVEASVESSITDGARDCTLDQGEEGTGFLNEATVAVGNDVLTDDDCGDVPGPGIGISKTVTSGPTLNVGGTYGITYEIVVTNTEDGPGTYDLDDELLFGDGIEVVAAAVANTAPGDIVVDATWDGITVRRVVTATGIAARTSHVYLVEVEALVATTITSEQGDCEVMENETGTGLLNTATVTMDGETSEDSACREVPGTELALAKIISEGPTANADGTYTIAYDIVVTNGGEGPTTYDLSDELKYGAGIAVIAASVANTTPGGIAVNGTWDGLADLTVATGVGIGAGQAHTYRVEVTAALSGDLTAESADCVLGNDEDGTGYLNVATLAYDGGVLEDSDCAPAELEEDEPMLEAVLGAFCENDTPWLGYEIAVSDDLAGLMAHITFSSDGGSETYTLPIGSGRLLWPGAEVDGDGNPIDWPGWDVDEDGDWFLNPDDPYHWARGDVEVTVQVNPTVGPVTLAYPPAEPSCDAGPPTGDDDGNDDDGNDDDGNDDDGDDGDDDGNEDGGDGTKDADDDGTLPFTGMPTVLLLGVGFAMVLSGGTLLRSVRRRGDT